MVVILRLRRWGDDSDNWQVHIITVTFIVIMDIIVCNNVTRFLVTKSRQDFSSNFNIQTSTALFSIQSLLDSNNGYRNIVRVGGCLCKYSVYSLLYKEDIIQTPSTHTLHYTLIARHSRHIAFNISWRISQWTNWHLQRQGESEREKARYDIWDRRWGDQKL